MAAKYYTPRPLIKTIVKVVQPKIGETVYDGAAGCAGFLCEAFDYLRQGGGLPARTNPHRKDGNVLRKFSTESAAF